MLLQRTARHLFATLGVRVMRESTYQAAVKAEAARIQYDATRDGSLSVEEYQALRALIDRANTFAGPIIEIGTLFGRTTSKMAMWKQDGKPLITVDNYQWNPWAMTPDLHFQLTSLVLQYLVESGHVIQVRADKHAWYSRYQGERPAMLFCDAHHGYAATAADIRFALDVGARIISGHDYSEQHRGVMKAVDEHGGPVSLTGSLWQLRTA